MINEKQITIEVQNWYKNKILTGKINKINKKVSKTKYTVIKRLMIKFNIINKYHDIFEFFYNF
jgi:hypothetical protein